MDLQECSHFDQIRNQNRRLIRNCMRHFAQIGKTELSDLSGLSFPTVSALLGELVATGEVAVMTETSTRGGRPGANYALHPTYRTALCAHFENHVLYTRINDVFGTKLSEDTYPFPGDITPETVCKIISDLQVQFPTLYVICLGVPGVVVNGYIEYLPDYAKLHAFDLKAYLEGQLGIAIFIENDVNVFVSAERDLWPNLVHIFLGHNCPGSGILIGGNLISGANGCAGELECMYGSDTTNNRSLGEELAYVSQSSTGEKRASEQILCLARAINAFICTVNPHDVALSGFSLDQHDLTQLHNEIKKRIPENRIPALHIVADVDALYHTGLWEMALEYLKAK